MRYAVARAPPPGGGRRERFALGRLRAGVMNKSEAAYAAHLEGCKQAGSVLWWKFEGLKFRLADGCFYTPDFAVLNAANEMELHEVKGFWQEDARVKIKCAAELFPFRFVALTARSKKAGGGWQEEQF
jgi:hypothetical protein